MVKINKYNTISTVDTTYFSNCEQYNNNCEKYDTFYCCLFIKMMGHDTKFHALFFIKKSINKTFSDISLKIKCNAVYFIFCLQHEILSMMQTLKNSAGV